MSDCSGVADGYTCDPGDITTASVCTLDMQCGNGVRDTHDGITEPCDDGNTVSGDGCSATCNAIESGYTCQSKYDYDGIDMPDEL